MEKNEVDLENCRENLVKFWVDVYIVYGKVSEGLNEFVDFDVVFIGGIVGGMEIILDVCCSCLNLEGCIVLNVVIIENLVEVMKVFKEWGFEIVVIFV